MAAQCGEITIELVAPIRWMSIVVLPVVPVSVWGSLVRSATWHFVSDKIKNELMVFKLRNQTQLSSAAGAHERKRNDYGLREKYYYPHLRLRALSFRLPFPRRFDGRRCGYA